MTNLTGEPFSPAQFPRAIADRPEIIGSWAAALDNGDDGAADLVEKIAATPALSPEEYARTRSTIVGKLIGIQYALAGTDSPVASVGLRPAGNARLALLGAQRRTLANLDRIRRDNPGLEFRLREAMSYDALAND